MAGPPPTVAARAAGRLTAELISASPQGLNTVGEYELSIRGQKIGAIENLAVTHDVFDCLDLSDNDLLKLEGFSALPKLKSLLLHNNRITRIDRDIGRALPPSF
jgi:U2 small nuclear ribonucleoprotein A'